MAITYLDCPHGNKLKDCFQCEAEKSQRTNAIADFIKEAKEDKRIPIYRGCKAALPEFGGCMCTGRCKEIIGYQE